MNPLATADEPFLFSDTSLARRLEKAEGLANTWFVEARAHLNPESGAQWIEVAGARAMFDGVSSPLTQTFGLGLFGEVSGADLDRIERFYQDRTAATFHEVSPLADPALFPLLNERGYRPVEFTSVMFRRVSKGLSLPSTNDRVRVRQIEPGEQELWARTAAQGWSEFPDLGDFILEFGRVYSESQGAVPFLAELGGEPIATGSLVIAQGVALLAGASTVPAHRKMGAQLALLDGRLRCAAERGCDLAMLCAQPGSISQRNGERQGFRIAYTRTKWQLTRGSN
ncbi:MAG: hypothetical protein AB1898_17515 [Acidobacteriota bacterium]